MNRLLVFLTFFALIVTEVTSQARCNGAALSLPDDKNATMNDCFTQFGEKFNNGGGQEPKNITCIWVCYIKKTGVMSQENKFLKDKLDEHLKSYGIPKDSVEPLAKELATCIDTKGSRFEIKNGSCENIMEVFDCFGAAYNKVCNPKKP